MRCQKSTLRIAQICSQLPAARTPVLFRRRVFEETKIYGSTGGSRDMKKKCEPFIVAFSLLAPRVSRIAVLATIPNRERAPRTFLLFSVLFSFSLLVLSHRFPTKMSVYSSTNQRERTRTLSTDPDDRKGDECDTVASSLTISTAKRFVTYSYCFDYDWCCSCVVFFSAFSSTTSTLVPIRSRTCKVPHGVCVSDRPLLFLCI